jgi:2-oxoisovalerate dehydrogenase E1 component
MNFNKKNLSNEKLIELYKNIALPRAIEEKMLLLLRQGKVSKWFSGIGQEAISVGVASALAHDEWVMPLHRNLGIFTTRKMPLDKLFMQLQGKKNGFSKGRERSFHFGSAEHHICGMISHLGPQLSLADGTALAYKLRKENKVSVTFTGDGGTSQGDFHEALNTAAVWGLPVIFIIENNGYGLSTPTNEQFVCEKLSDRAIGYGMKGITIDGNNLLEVYHNILEAKKYCIENQKPILIECMTFRMRGHEEASGVKYVPKELFEQWGKLDPVMNFENYLLEEKIIAQQFIDETKANFKHEIESNLEICFNSPEPVANTEEEIADIFAPYSSALKFKKNTDASFLSMTESKGLVILSDSEESSPTKEMRLVDAISEGLKQSMQKHSNLIVMGQDVAEYGGVFKITDGFVAEFGKERVRNTTLCESAIIGISLGLSLEKYKAVMEMQFADFVTEGFNQIVNNLAKIHYRWGQNADVVVRMPTGAGVGAGPFHSQSNEAWFTKVPGLKVVYPSTPADAKGLLIAAINDPNPVMFFEHKALYRSVSGMVPSDYYEIEIGKANVVQEGNDVSIITYGAGVHWALEISKTLDMSIEILDLRTLAPLDYEAIEKTVKKTGKVLVLHEDTLIGGIGGEISAWINEHCFESLDAPVMRCASLDTPVPFAIPLENNFLAKARLKESLEKLVGY